MIALVLAATLAVAPAPRAGRDVLVDVPTAGTVVAVAADAHVRADVEGDVVAIAGSVLLAPGVRVQGDVVALGGTVEGAGRVEGRRVGVGPLAGGTSLDRTGAGLLLLRLGGWMLLATAALLVLRGSVRAGGEVLARAPGRTLLVGALALAVWLAFAVLAFAGSGTPLGVALVVLAVVVLLAGKVIGLAAVAWLLGRALARVLPLALRAELPATGLGMLVAVGASALPVVGPGLWLLANVAALGGLVTALLARRPLPLALARAIAG